MANSNEMKNENGNQIPRRDMFPLIRLIMRVSTMYPIPLESYLPASMGFMASTMHFLIDICSLFGTIHIAVLYLCTLYMQEEADLEFRVSCLIQFIIYLWAIGMQIYFRRIRPKLLNDIMDSLNSEYRTRSAEGLTYVKMDECIDKANKYMNIFGPACFSGTAVWSIIPLAYGDRSLPLPCWYPIDTKAPIIYETLYVIQFIAQIQVAGAFAASSGFHMILAILISGQYDILHCSLKNIIATSYIKMGAKESDLIELEKKQEIANTERNQYYCSNEHTDDYTHSAPPPQQRQRRQQQREANNFLQAFRASLRDCVTHHRYILRILMKMEKFYNFLWMIKSAEVIFLICLVAFVSVKSTENSSIMKIFSLAQYLFLVVWELFIICYFSEIITQNSERCDEALMRSPWNLHMRETKLDVLFFLLNSRCGFKLTAGKMYSLDIPRFRAIITTSFSFFTFLQKMDQRN